MQNGTITSLNDIRGINNHPLIKANKFDWNFQNDVDRGFLADRIKYCEYIREDTFDILSDVLVTSGIVKRDQFIFAGIKGYDRSSVKLDE